MFPRRRRSLVMATWPHQGKVANNWGDKANPWLVHRLSGRPVANVRQTLGWGKRPVHRVIGSGLADTRPGEVVWGTGLIRSDARLKARADEICAVRGPMTRQRLADLGIDAPAVYGDPVVLFPLLYSPEVEVVHDVGIIQHFREIEVVDLPQVAGTTSVVSIDIRAGVEELVDHVLACRTIVSSSLHGLIVAHAYGIPAYWVKASDLPLGDDFKFHDYFASIGHPDVTPGTVKPDGTVDIDHVPGLPVAGYLDGNGLLEACPFLDRRRLRHWKQRLAAETAAGRSGTIFNL